MGPIKTFRCLTFVAVSTALWAGPHPAFAQRRALRRAIVNTVLLNRQPTLLDRIFSPGGAAFRNDVRRSPFSRRPPIFQPTINFNNYLSDGTPLDAYSLHTALGRFNQTGPYDLSANRAAAVTAPLAGTADMSAPSPAHTMFRSAAPPLANYLSTPVAPTAYSPRVATAQPAPTPPQQVPLRADLFEALWTIQKQRRSATAHLPPPSPPIAPRVRPQSPAAPSFDAMDTIDAALAAAAGHAFEGRYTQARAAYQRSIDLGCHDARAHIGLATALFGLGDFAAAGRAVARDATTSPRLDRSRLDLRMGFKNAAHFDGQLARLAGAAQASPNDADLWLLLGYVRRFSGDPVGGRSAWRRYLALPDADPSLRPILLRWMAPGS